jgi:glucose/arabinose dehydrogenase
LRPVVQRVLACAVLPCLFLVAACGEKDEPDPTGPPVVDAPTNPPSQPGGDIPVGDGDGGVGLQEIGEFEEPVFVAQPKGDNALYVVERAGRILRVAPKGNRDVFLDISNKVLTEGTEQGLLSVAFAPDYERTGRFYVDYTDSAGDTRVVEYRARGNRADPRSARQLLRIADPYANHNGGLLLFDDEGRLLIGHGDGGSQGDPDRNGQNLGVLFAKILRIDPRPSGGEPYGTPGDNPFADEGGARPETLAYGLRNPWRFSFDRETGDLWIGDVGQSDQEEIDALARGEVDSGANFGWSAFEGTLPFNDDQEAPDAIDPVLTYGREGGCSVTGGYVVRDPALESLYGRYLYADYCVGQLRSFSAEEALEQGARDDTALGLQVPGVSSFGEDQEGHIYATSLEGPVYRLVPEGN